MHDHIVAAARDCQELFPSRSFDIGCERARVEGARGHQGRKAMTEAWKFQMARIRSLRLDLARADSDDAPLSGAHGASKRAISTAERKLRRRLPPSYRAFLCESDGWSRFFEGA